MDRTVSGLEKEMPLVTRWIRYAVLATVVLPISAGLTQVTTTPITSSGLNTQVSAPISVGGKTQYDITGGTRTGTNLFHSFGNFGVPNNNIANFQNDTGLATNNILGRVTGGNPSSILGTIQTTGFENANLYLMNPVGIVFGPTASLNVGGSATFTTADYLRLDKLGGPNAGIFHTDPAQGSLLSSAPVDAFGFLRPNPGAISIHGSQLTVPGKQEITLVGGNITIQSGTLENGTVQPARLSAPNGQITMASAHSPGEFLQNFFDVPNINEQSFTSIGYVHLASGSRVDVSPTGNGKFSIRGGQLVLDIQNSVLSTGDNATPTPLVPGQDTIVLTPTSEIISGTNTGSAGPDIHLYADRMTVVGIPSTRENFGKKPNTQIQSYTLGAGKAGDIVLRTNNDIELNKLVTISSITEASGQAGSIELTSTHGNVRLTEGGKESRGVSSSTITSGNTGNVTISAPEGDIILTGVPVVTQSQPRGTSPQETGRPGLVALTAKNLQMSAGTLGNFTSGADQPGGITVKLSGALTMTSDSSLNLPRGVLPDSLIVTSSVSRAPSGDITLTAKDILVSQKSIINSSSFASGAGGHLKIVTDTLQVMGGAQISSGSTRAPNRGNLRSFVKDIIPSGPGGDITIQALGPKGSVLTDGHGSGTFADTEGTGPGGSISLSARTLEIQNGGTLSASTIGTDSRAAGGTINIHVTDQVTLSSGSSITARSTGPANAGSISINAGKQLDLTEKSSITTESTQASGGNINIQAVDRIRLVNSSITTSVPKGTGNGGNISIDPNVMVLQNSNILAQAARGQGGNIDITTPVWVQDQTSQVDASSQFGMNGTVTIQSPVSNISGTVGQLVSKMSPHQVLLQNRCVALAAGEQSTFLLAGRETLPHEPGGWLSSPVSVEHWTEENTEHAAGLVVQNRGLNAAPTVALQKNTPAMLSLRRLTPPGFLVQTFATEATGCPS